MARLKQKQITVEEFNDLCAVAAIRGSFYDKGTDKQKFYSIDNIDNIEIKFQIGKLRDRGIFRVNRINGKLFTANFEDGQCYKGFKEYEKQI